MDRGTESRSRSFEIESEEGLPIRGEIVVPARPIGLVVIVHGFKGFKDWGFFPWLSQYLLRHGLASCRFNMSRSGVGGSSDAFDRLDLFADDTYSTQLDDLLSVMTYLDSDSLLGSLPRFLLGHSRGGAIALLVAPLLDICTVVTWSAIANLDRWDRKTVEEWRRQGHLDIVNSRTGQLMRLSTRVLDDLEENAERLDLDRALETLDRPLLVVHGAADETVSPEDSWKIAQQVSDASHLLIGDASHTMNAIHPLINVPPALTLAAEASARHMTQHCRISMMRVRR